MNKKLKLIAITVLLLTFCHLSYTTVAQDSSIFISVFTAKDNGLDISAQLATSTTQNTISAYYDGANTYYLFLPAYATDKKLSFTCGDFITLTAVNESTYQYNINGEYSLTLLFGSDIPVIHMTLEHDLSYITSDKTLTDSGQITMLNADGSIVYIGDLEEIKGRGNASWELDKKPFQFQLPHVIEAYDISATDEFSLVSARDYSYLRNFISNEMADTMGAFTLDCTHIDLYINNEYQGVYELWNKLEPNTLGITDMEAENKDMISKMPELNQLTTNTYLDDWNHTVTGKWWDYTSISDNITGGYILEGDYPARYATEASGFTLDSGAYMVAKSPKYLSTKQYDYISEYMKTCESILYESVGLDNYDAMSEYIDVDSFINKYLVEEVCKNVECSSTSQYFYKDADDVLYAGPVWDYDSAYGVAYSTDDIDFSTPNGFSARNIPGSFNWWQLLYYNKAFYADMTDMYTNTLYPYLNKLIETHIPNWEARLTNSAVMDALKWKRAASLEAARTVYHNEVTSVSDFLKARKEFLYNEWN